jgi:hypothetical protein
LTGCRKRSGIVAMALMGVVGCGLSDYEKRMDEQRRRVQEYDDTNNLLEDPLEMLPNRLNPKEEGKSIWPDFFLRLPKGFGTKEKHKDRMLYNWPFLGHYTCDDPALHLYVAAVGLADHSGQEDLINAKYTLLNFRKIMKVAVEMVVRKQHWEPNWKKLSDKEFSISEAPAERVGVKQLTPLSGPTPSLTYTMIAYREKKSTENDPPKFLAYFYDEKPKQICIIVQHPVQLSPDHAFHKQVEVCLGTLDLSSDAAKRRTDYFQLKRR